MEETSAQLFENVFRRPDYPLDSKKCLQVIEEGIKRGQESLKKIEDRSLIAILGAQGSGKTSLIKFLQGLFQPDDERMPPSFLPSFESDGEGNFYGEFPACHIENFSISIAKNVTVQSAFMAARSIKLIFLVKFATLKDKRGQILYEIAEQCHQLFGSKEEFIKHSPSCLLGITHIPAEGRPKPLQKLKAALVAPNDPEPIQSLSELAERVFILDPFQDEYLNYRGALSRSELKEMIRTLPSIRKGTHYKITLTSDAILGLDAISREVKFKVATYLDRTLADKDFEEIASMHASLLPLASFSLSHFNQALLEINEIIASLFRPLILKFSNLLAEESIESFLAARNLLNHLERAITPFHPTLRQFLMQLFDESLPTSLPASKTSQIVRTASINQLKHHQRLQELLALAKQESSLIGERLYVNANEFKKESLQIIETLDELRKQTDEDLRDNVLTAERLAQLFSIHEFVLSAHRILSETTWQYIRLETKGVEAKSHDFNQVVSLALYARSSDIQFLMQQLRLLESEQDHKWAIYAKIHAAKILEETFLYNDLLKVRELKLQMKKDEWETQKNLIEVGREALAKKGSALHNEEKIYAEYHQRKLQLFHQQLKQAAQFDVEARIQLIDLLKTMLITS